MPKDPTDEQGRPWRWGEPLSRADADAIARRYAEGHERTNLDREQEINEWVEREVRKSGFGLLNDVRNDMVERGITQTTSEVDPVLLEHTICEEQCAREFGHLSGAALDDAFWRCMDQCSPNRMLVYGVDPDNPAAPPPSPELSVPHPRKKR